MCSIPVQVGARSSPRRVQVARFGLRGGPGAVCLQLQDEEGLRRGGVYLQRGDDPEQVALAPRFDELFADAAVKLSETPALGAPLLDLLRSAHEVARQTRPLLTPESLARLTGVAAQAAELERAHPDCGGVFRLEPLVLSCLLIFVSEEERYPRPRYQGADMALARMLEVLTPA